jgi:2-octaprenyl-6-methoxyphenol hydroxylase
VADTDFDVTVVGGGLVGASLARALAPLPLRVALVEAVPPRAPGQPSYDDRTTVLSRASRLIFEGIGLWPEMAAEAEPVRRVHVSERGRFGFTRIDAAQEGVDALGHVVPNRLLGRVLGDGLERIAGQADFEFFCPARLERLTQREDRVELGLAGDAPQTVSTRLLVGADGTGSRVRGALGIGVRAHDYRQHAVIANLTPKRPHLGTAYERFTPDGPVALLPMDASRCGLVWTVPASRSETLLALEERAFLRALHEKFGHRLSHFSRLGQRQAYPLKRTLARQHHVGRGLLIGNAAHSVHPVAAQGFNLGMRDVAVLAELLADTAGDPGAEALLNAYTQWRKTDQRAVSNFTDTLTHLFSNRIPLIAQGRSLALSGLGALTPAKHRFARARMGLTGRVPRLARGAALHSEHTS